MKVLFTIYIFFVTVALIAAAPEVLEIEEDNLVDPSMNKVEEMIESARTVMLAALDSLMETEAAAMKENERRCGGRLMDCAAEEKERQCGRLSCDG